MTEQSVNTDSPSSVQDVLASDLADVPLKKDSGANSNSGSGLLDDVDDLFARLGKNGFEDDDSDEEDIDELESTSQDSFEMELVTMDSRLAWFGKPRTAERPGFPGVDWFAIRIGKLCRAVQEDDPYAIKGALEIEYLLHDIDVNLKTYAAECDGLLNSAKSSGLVFKGVSKKRYDPMSVGFSPSNGYAVAAASLISRYDKVVMASHLCRDFSHINTARFRGMKNRKDFRSLTGVLYNSLRSISGTTRQDFRDGTKEALDALKLHGPIPEEILDPEFELRLIEMDTSWKG